MLKGAFQFCLGSDHFQPVMVLSLEHAPLTSPYQRFFNVSTFYNELTNCQTISPWRHCVRIFNCARTIKNP